MHGGFDLQQLRMFVALARTGGYTKAAEQVSRTQSAVSHAIRKLEASAGVRLVRVQGRTVRLTEEGRLLYEACERAFTALDGAAEAIARREGHALGRVRLGTSAELGSALLVEHLVPFLSAHPEVDVEVTLGDDLIGPLLRDELDMLVDEGERSAGELERLDLFAARSVAVCSPSYQEARPVGSAGGLASCAVLSRDRAGADWERLLRASPAGARARLGRIVVVSTVAGMVAAAKAGAGVALVPRYAVREGLEAGTLVEVPLDAPMPEWRVCLLQKRSRASLARHRLVTEHLRGLTLAATDLW